MANIEPTDTAGSVLNMSAISAIQAIQRPGGPDLLSRVVGLYRQTAPKLLADLDGALERNEFEAARSAAHSLKSSSRNLGAETLAEHCEYIERAIRMDAFAELPKTVSDLSGELDRVFGALSRLTD